MMRASEEYETAEKYVLEVLGITKRDLLAFSDNFRSDMEFWLKMDYNNTIGMATHSSKIYQLTKLFTHFPGYKNIDRALDCLARDGCDFNPPFCLVSPILMYHRPGVWEGSHLDVILLNHIQPFAAEIVQKLIANGLSSFKLNKRPGLLTLNFLLFMLIERSYSALPDDVARFRFAVQHLVETMVDLGIHHDYKIFKQQKVKCFMRNGYLGYHEEVQMFNKARQYLVETRRQPLSLQAIARNATRNAVGGVHFRARVATLPLPQTMKDYVMVYR